MKKENFIIGSFIQQINWKMKKKKLIISHKQQFKINNRTKDLSLIIKLKKKEKQLHPRQDGQEKGRDSNIYIYIYMMKAMININIFMVHCDSRAIYTLSQFCERSYQRRKCKR